MSDQAPANDRDGDLAEAPAGGRLAVLESALWKRVAAAETIDVLAPAWLALVCRTVPDVAAGAVLLVGADRSLSPLASWPREGRPAPALVETAEIAAREGRGVAQSEPGRPSCVAYPVVVDGMVLAVAALTLRSGGREELGAAVRQLQWGAPWLSDRLRQRRASEDRRLLQRSRGALDLLATVLEQDRFAGACMAAVTDLAIAFDCLRVSIGFRRGDAVRVAAISHSAQFGHQMNLVRKVGACMEEALDQRGLVAYPAPAGDAVSTHAHAELARLQNDGRVLTVPLLVVDRFVGAVTFERAGDEPFRPETIEVIEATCAAVAPVLEERRQNDRWLATKAAESVGRGFRRLAGPGHTAAKLAFVLTIAAAVFFTFARDTYRIGADARIEGSVRRAIVAASDGFLKEASARAGDRVEAGAPLAALEDRDLALERLRWVTERQQRTYEYDRALATRQPAQINVTKSQIDQADAQIKLIDEQLSRTKLRAPFDGLIVSGDLSQSIGGAVSRGQVLFEIAPLDRYRVILNVDEKQIADVAVGQTGHLLASSLPDEPFTLTVEKITPVAEARGGRNLFRVEARLDRVSERLRPGMEGIAKIDVDERRLIAIWTRPFMDWLRIFAWQWLP